MYYCPHLFWYDVWYTEKLKIQRASYEFVVQLTLMSCVEADLTWLRQCVVAAWATPTAMNAFNRIFRHPSHRVSLMKHQRYRYEDIAHRHMLSHTIQLLALSILWCSGNSAVWGKLCGELNFADAFNSLHTSRHISHARLRRSGIIVKLSRAFIYHVYPISSWLNIADFGPLTSCPSIACRLKVDCSMAHGYVS